MKKTSEEFVERALENAQEDREKLLRLYDLISRGMLKEDEAMTDEELSTNAMIAREHLTGIMDSLTKQTSQVIELAKIKQRSEQVKKTNDDDDEDLTDDDYEKIYDVIDKRSDLEN